MCWNIIIPWIKWYGNVFLKHFRESSEASVISFILCSSIITWHLMSNYQLFIIWVVPKFVWQICLTRLVALPTSLICLPCVRYFNCSPLYGLFTPVHKLCSPLDLRAANSPVFGQSASDARQKDVKRLPPSSRIGLERRDVSSPVPFQTVSTSHRHYELGKKIK